MNLVAAREFESLRPRGEYRTVLCEEGRNADLAVLTSGPFFAVAGCSPVAALGKRGTHTPLVELAPLHPLVPLVPSCVFHSLHTRPTLQGALLAWVPKQPSSHTCCQGKVSSLEGSLPARVSLFCLPAVECLPGLLGCQFVSLSSKRREPPRQCNAPERCI